MRRKSFLFSVIVVAILSLAASSLSLAIPREVQEQGQNVNKNNNRSHRRRHVVRRHKRKDIKVDYAGAGKSASHPYRRQTWIFLELM